MLYFSILKNPRPTPLLPAALRGIARFAHLVNVDFFKDLMNTLKEIVGDSAMENPATDGQEGEAAANEEERIDGLALRLQCIITAFELLTGQGSPSFYPLQRDTA